MSAQKGWHIKPTPIVKQKPFGARFIDFLIVHPAIFVIAALVASSLLSYGLALIGEPRAVWIWRDILGLV